MDQRFDALDVAVDTYLLPGMILGNQGNFAEAVEIDASEMSHM